MIEWLWLIGFPVTILAVYLFNKFKYDGNASADIVGLGIIFYALGFYILVN